MNNFLSFIGLLLIFSCCNNSITQNTYVNKKILIKDAGLFVDQFEVTIGEFYSFVSSNSYISTADSLKWSGVFNTNNGNWDIVEYANWQKPTGKEDYPDYYPVSQVSYYDAHNYCKSKKGRLPSADEWDIIAGDSIITGNVWQGLFPVIDEGKDGYSKSVAPVGQFYPNKYGVHDLFGNVWEWTSSKSYNGQMIIKGGSFLCDYDICSGFIPERYQTTAKDSGLNHLGFRCVYSSQ